MRRARMLVRRVTGCAASIAVVVLLAQLLPTTRVSGSGWLSKDGFAGSWTAVDATVIEGVPNSFSVHVDLASIRPDSMRPPANGTVLWSGVLQDDGGDRELHCSWFDQPGTGWVLTTDPGDHPFDGAAIRLWGERPMWRWHLQHAAANELQMALHLNGEEVIRSYRRTD